MALKTKQVFGQFPFSGQLDLFRQLQFSANLGSSVFSECAAFKLCSLIKAAMLGMQL